MLIGWEHERITLRMLRKLDPPRGRDSWCWPKRARPPDDENDFENETTKSLAKEDFHVGLFESSISCYWPRAKKALGTRLTWHKCSDAFTWEKNARKCVKEISQQIGASRVRVFLKRTNVSDWQQIKLFFVSWCYVPTGARFSELPVITGPVKLCFYPILDGSFKGFENCTVKLSAKETKWTLLEVRTHPTFLETDFKSMISGPLSYRVFRKTGPWPLKYA